MGSRLGRSQRLACASPHAQPRAGKLCPCLLPPALQMAAAPYAAAKAALLLAAVAACVLLAAQPAGAARAAPPQWELGWRRLQQSEQQGAEGQDPFTDVVTPEPITPYQAMQPGRADK